MGEFSNTPVRGVQFDLVDLPPEGLDLCLKNVYDIFCYQIVIFSAARSRKQNDGRWRFCVEALAVMAGGSVP